MNCTVFFVLSLWPILGVGLSRFDKSFVLSCDVFKLSAREWKVEENGEFAANGVNSQMVPFIGPDVPHDTEYTFH